MNDRSVAKKSLRDRLKERRFALILLFAAAIVAGVVANNDEQRRTTVQGSHLEYQIELPSTWTSADGLARQVLGKAWTLGSDHPNVQTIALSVSLDVRARRDRYGESIGETLQMGVVNFSSESVAEMRRYSSQQAYSEDVTQRAIMAARLKSMRGGELL